MNSGELQHKPSTHSILWESHTYYLALMEHVLTETQVCILALMVHIR